MHFHMQMFVLTNHKCKELAKFCEGQIDACKIYKYPCKGVSSPVIDNKVHSEN